jgi:DNA-directed RNA polymerase specialized sigma24 family protein
MVAVRKRKPSKTSDLRFESVHEADFDGANIAGDRKSGQFIAPEPVDEHRLDKFRRLVDQAIGSLPPQEQEVLLELRKNNNSIRRASRTLGMDWTTERDRRDRAIARLKPMLA